jgi:ATP-binding cassette subfamily F protein uup
MLVRLREAYLKFGIFALLDKVNFVINPGDKIALLGRNGTGKSTLLKVIKGLQKLDSGIIEYASSIKIGMLEQEFAGTKNESIFDIVADGLGAKGELLKQYNNFSMAVAKGNYEALEQMQEVQNQIDDQHAWDAQNQVDTIMSKLNLDRELIYNSLSGGLKRRVLLAKALVQNPDLLLLDEPTNHLDIESIQWLENLLINLKTSVLFISHDREFVRKVANRIIELDRGVLSDWPGNYAAFLRKKEEFLHAEELENKRFDKKLAQEEVWIRQGIKARRTRNEGRVLALKQMRQERAKRQERQGNISAVAQEAIRSGHKVIEATNITKIYSDKPVVKDFSSLIMRGDKIAIIGPNGAGKTTLINMLLGKLAPDSGKVEHGTNLEIAYFDQLRAELDEKLSVRDNVSQGSDSVTINGKDKHVIGYLQDFLFSPERANSPITVLSGGEKNRLLLAKLFTKPSNLLVLDEPTNDLDIETLELLEELLVNYNGTLLLISHDREFINNVVTSTIVFEGDGIVNEYVGDYNDWLKQRKQLKPEQKTVVKAAAQAQQQKINIKSNNNLNYAEKKELEKLPKLIEQLEQEQQDFQSQTTLEGFYQQAPTKTKPILDKLSKIEQELQAAYKRWEELEG